MALVVERELRTQRKLDRAHAAMRQDMQRHPAARADPARHPAGRLGARRGPLRGVRRATFELQFDHAIPFALGGATTVENLQLLCAGCNRVKGASL